MGTRITFLARRGWDAIGVGSNVKGRVSFVIWVIGLGVTVGGFAISRLGAVVGGITIAGIIMFGAGLWGAITAVREEEHRKKSAAVSGTLIPPGWAACVTGAQSEPGEWVPPGFSVAMDPSTAVDEHGNTAMGPNARIYGGVGNMCIGSNQIGERPY